MRSWRRAWRSATRANSSSQWAQNWSVAAVVGAVGVRFVAIGTAPSLTAGADLWCHTSHPVSLSGLMPPKRSIIRA
jgi:hypothetical protein